jgi:hypothetical protein
VLDFEGCGTALPTALALEAQLDRRLHTHWRESAKSIVIEPELDVWLWGADNAVETAIEWQAVQRVRDWLRERGFTFETNGKPTRPKEAFEAALRVPALPRSSSLYRNIAECISLRHCKDGAFIRLREQLLQWFPPQKVMFVAT